MTDTRSFKQIVQFATRNAGEGTLVEPRSYYDFLDYTGDSFNQLTPKGNTDPGAFTNGEQFPVRLTHFIVSPDFKLVDSDLFTYVYNDAALSVQLRLERYDEFYMNEFEIRAPGWHNVNIAPPAAIGNSQVTCTLAQALILSARDSLRVTAERVPFSDELYVGAETPEEGTLGLTFTMTGVGLISGRVYNFGSVLSFELAGQVKDFDPSNLQNIGGEPVAITQMSFQVGAGNVFTQGETSLGSATSPAMFDTRMFRVQIRQQGNGTQANFFHGPTYPTLIERMPLSLWGTDVGQSIVHRFPGDGLKLDPGATIRIYGSRLPALGADAEAREDFAAGLHYPDTVAIGLHGYMMVK